MGIFDNTIYDNRPIEWENKTNNSISNAINDNINNKPTYGAISSAINDEVNAPGDNFSWGNFGKSLLGGLNFGGATQTPQIRFQPTMMQPQYVNTNFQNQISNIARNNLYNAIMR